MWLDPRVFTEIVRRAGLSIEAMFWLHDRRDHRTVPFKHRLLHLVASLLYRWRRYFAPHFLIVLKLPEI